ncbi:MAG: DUF302 domain-containing protein [Methanobacteriota archaeon]|nr:MAG: DUF302 domain-containing protein [Euryarchaeota archaeon]
MEYAISTRLDVSPERFNEVEERLREILQSKGFGILTEIDVKETLKKKLNVEYTPYKILGACNPPRAHRALQAEPDIGVLLPCNVILYVEGNNIIVSAMNPASALGFVENSEIDSVGKEVEEIMREVVSEVEDSFKN